MYRTRRHGSQKFNEKMARWRDIQLRKKLEEPAPYYGPEPPEIRRRIIVEDYDGPETTRHEIILHRSNRIDCYLVEVDGRMLPGRKGWSSVLEMIRHSSDACSPRSPARKAFWAPHWLQNSVVPQPPGASSL